MIGPRPRFFDFPRPVWLLGWVSLATDAASEAIYPLLPFFLTQVLGAGAVSLGVIEGAAEAANSLLKVGSGRMADWTRTKRPLVLAGYALSSLARPLIAMTTTWPQVLAVRVADRVGKGVRSAPRDALLATLSVPGTRGRVFGFHQGMDHLGAVVGPVLASLFLVWHPGQYRTLFALTALPGAVAVLLVLFVRERDRADMAGRGGEGSRAAWPERESGRASGLPRQFHLFLGVLAIFTLGNSTDAFLLLRLTDTAGSVRYVPLMWAGLHVVKTVASMAGGGWSDWIGRRVVIGAGWLVYAIVYMGFAWSTSLAALLAWFGVYGLYFGFAESAEKALVADLAPLALRGTAFGLYNAVAGLGSLAASLVFGVLWQTYGAPVAFTAGAALALAATVLLFVVIAEPGRRPDVA